MSIYLIKYQNNKPLSCERTRRFSKLRDNNGYEIPNSISKSKGVVEVYVRTEDEEDAKAQAEVMYKTTPIFHD